MSLGLFGLLFGSFANVLILRLPRGESVFTPRSRCPSCGHPIRWFDNVPLLSWIVLGGRCRDCGARVSGRYPLVELCGGLLWLLAGVRFGPTPRSLLCAGFFSFLLVLAFIDLDTRRLPNAIVGIMALVGALGAVVSQTTGIALAPLVSIETGRLLDQPVIAAVLGAALAAGLSGSIALLYARLRGRSGLGFGDVKLLAAMGLFLGPYVLATLLAGSLAGTIGGLMGAARDGEAVSTRQIPFGPYLALGGTLSIVASPVALGWYTTLLR